VNYNFLKASKALNSGSNKILDSHMCTLLQVLALAHWSEALPS
jgi:hypothetical protein